MTPPSQTQRTSTALFWSAVEKAAGQGVSFVVTLVLARFLGPADYGAVAMLVVFTALARPLVDAGLSQALVREQNRSHDDCDTVFWTNAALALALYALLWLAAPLIASFYDLPQLTRLLRWLALTVPLGALSNVSAALAQAHLRLHVSALATLGSALCSGSVGVISAINGNGSWALVHMELTYAALRALLVGLLQRWWPTLTWRRESFRRLFGLASRLLAANVLNEVSTHLPPLLIGRSLGAAPLGLFARAQHLCGFLSAQPLTMLHSVAYPLLCQRANDHDRQRATLDTTLRLATFLLWPMLAGIALVSQPLIDVLLGDKWTEAAPFITIIALALTPSILAGPLHSFVLSSGKPNDILRLEVARKVVEIALLCVALPWGLTAVAVAVAPANVIVAFLTLRYARRAGAPGAAAILRRVAGAAVCTLTMCLTTFLCGRLLADQAPWLRLAAGVAVGVATYLAAAIALRRPEPNELLLYLRRRR